MSRSSRRRSRRKAAKRRAKRFPRPPKHLSMFQVAVDPFRKVEYDPGGKRLTKAWNDAAIGFVCPVCKKSSNGWFFWVDRSMAVCEDCVIFSEPYINHLHKAVESLIYKRKLRECNESLITSMGGGS